MSSNTHVKRKMVRIFGPKCFIEELGIRSKEEVQAELKTYKSKSQRAVMDELTYHHIVEQFKGGRATVENGALLRNINHQWFNRLSKQQQAEINRLFQEYKRAFYEECEVVVVDELPTKLSVKAAEVQVDERGRLYNRAKEKQATRKAYNDYLDSKER